MDKNQPSHFNADIDLHVGREFQTFDEFKTVLQNRQALFGDSYRINSACSKTVNATNIMVDNPKLHMPKHLKYSYCSMSCVRSGTYIPDAVLKNRPVKKQRT